jgi:homocysteine S-methyltransferase
LTLQQALWSAAAILHHPTEVKRVHLDYMCAGSDIFITSSYQASILGFKTHANLNREEAIKALKVIQYVSKLIGFNL